MSDNKRIVITGLGIIAPGALNVNKFWQNLIENKITYEILNNNISLDTKIKICGKVEDFSVSDSFPQRFTKKCDNMSIFSLCAVDQVLQDGRLKLTRDKDDYSVGIFLGNNSGGWLNAQAGLNTLHDLGKDEYNVVSPYLASNWFPAATQGYLSLYFDIKGYSKTIVADKASSSVAIGYACRSLQNGVVDYILAGGNEALSVPWGLIFYQTIKEINFDSNIDEEEGAYRPFANNSSGFVLAEGAAYVLLESYESARNRDAHIYAEVSGFGITNDGQHQDSDYFDQYCRAMEIALGKNGLPDLIMLDGTAYKQHDNMEANGIKKCFGEDLKNILLTCPKAFYGNSYGAASVMDVITACLMLESDTIVPCGKVKDVMAFPDFNLVTGNAEEKKIEKILVNAKGFGGINSSLLIKKV